MVFFSTILPVKEDVSCIDMFEAITDWEENKKVVKHFEELDDVDVYHYSKEGGILWSNASGLKKCKALPWTQTFIFEKDNHRIHIMQETPVQLLNPEVLELKYVTPSIITALIDKNILNGIYKKPVKQAELGLMLPILMVNNEKAADKLAFRLKGSVQVVYDPMGDNRIIYNGKETKIDIKDAVHRILEYGRLNLYDPKYSWEYIKSVLEYKQTGKDIDSDNERLKRELLEGKELIAAYEEEIESLTNKNIEANNKLNANSLKIAGLENKLKGDIPLLFYGEENDLYEGEIKDLVLSIIEKEYKNLPEKTRRKDILESLLKQNNITGVGADIIRQVKTALKGYKTLDGSTKNLLESLGFDVEKTGIHYKIRFKGDDRYLVVLSKTPSDHREGENAASLMTQTMF